MCVASLCSARAPNYLVHVQRAVKQISRLLDMRAAAHQWRGRSAGRCLRPALLLALTVVARSLHLPSRAALSEWKQWMPYSKPGNPLNANHWGNNAEWRRWLAVPPKPPDAPTAAAPGEDDDWSTFSFGSFAAAGQQHPSRSQAAFTTRLASSLAPELRETDPLWAHLSDEQVTRGLAALRPYCTPDRLAKFDAVLAGRTDFVRFVFEHPANANNAWAALRSFDGFGLQVCASLDEGGGCCVALFVSS